MVFIVIIINKKFFQNLESLSNILNNKQENIPESFHYKPADLANMDTTELLTLYDRYAEIMVYIYLDDRINYWNKVKVIIEGIYLNIYYGIDNAFCKDHGHYTVYMNDGKFYYRRKMYEPHGKQNYIHE